MKLRTIYGFLCLTLLFPIGAFAAHWQTHLAYNNVTQIAMAEDEVFAISDGSLFSIDKQTEKLRTYDRMSGLHGTGITCIHYDKVAQQLLICYADGKIDILTARGMKYISELYNKDMTQRKNIYNVTILGRTAYLSTHYGVQTLDLRENKLVDSYWLRPGGEETPINDVLIADDSIYAFTPDSLFCAALTDNLVDYHFWKREGRSGRIAPDPEKGIHYQDATSHWYAGGAEGIVRYTPTSRLTYKPEGPYVNTPYYLTTASNQLFMVAGGRWTAQHNNPGHVMRYHDKRWTTIHADTIQAKTGSLVLDMMNVAVDPTDVNHYFVTSYGTGLYEFRGDSCVWHTLANDVIGSVVPAKPERYTRLLGAHFDSQGRLWFLDSGSVPYNLIYKEGDAFYGLPLISDGQQLSFEMPADLVIDRRDERYKWIGIAYKGAGIVLLDDHQTPADASDDRCLFRKEWETQDNQAFKPTCLYTILQDSKNRIWIGTELGAAYIDAETDFFESNAIRLPEATDNNGERPLSANVVRAVCETPDGNIWVGTDALGVYVLNAEATQFLAHYTIDNSAMPANSVMSLACNSEGHVFIGTSEGLVEFDPNGTEGLNGNADEGENELDEGSMMRWRLHLSYTNPEEMVSTPRQVFAVANGSLFSVDRADESITYWNKSTGLNGSTVSHIAYDAANGVLLIAYADGRMDLLDDEGNVTQMPDLFMKAGSVSVQINCIHVGSRYTYIGTNFGIVAINTRKAEMADTYYIGSEAAAVEVQQIVSMGDSLYAFSYDKMYLASLKDNLVDYTFWHSQNIPCEKVQQALVWRDAIYTLQHDSLYRREGTVWQQVLPYALEWIHGCGGQLLTYRTNVGLLRLKEDDTTEGISANYVAKDAVYSLGEYWLAEDSKGLVRLGSSGDTRFIPEGPMSNFGYRLQVAHDRLYVAPGGRWASQFSRQCGMSIYDGNQWLGIPWQDTWYYTSHDIRDVVGYAVDANDPTHFFVSTYGTGFFEFRNNKGYKHFDASNNSTLKPADTGLSDYYYTRTDGPMMDEQGNVWVLNATFIGAPLHVYTSTGQWCSIPLYSGGESLVFETPTGIWIDQRNSQYKWLFAQRGKPQVVLLDDGGTPTYSGDDRCMARSTFTDQNGNVLSPANFRCFAQDQTKRIWVGTDKGIILFPASMDFFTSSSCRRIIIPRNDGTGLGDYLLGDEQINCLAVDGGNRIWIGTENSGLYLIEDDTITVAHFTETNSLLPSNSVQSIAIMPKTGEVFVGTDRGIASYRSDASEAQTTMSGAYAYPNPVRPDYGGMISITGLMDNTVVNIVDASGNLVCKTKSHGGTAVWDGKLPDGRRATAGVYTALCNAKGGHTVVKILVIR